VSIITGTYYCTDIDGPPSGPTVRKNVPYFLPIFIFLTVYHLVEGATDSFVRERRTKTIGGAFRPYCLLVSSFLNREVHIIQHGGDGVQSIASVLDGRQAGYEETEEVALLEIPLGLLGSISVRCDRTGKRLVMLRTGQEAVRDSFPSSRVLSPLELIALMRRTDTRTYGLIGFILKVIWQL
jgi:hypothetical protein